MTASEHQTEEQGVRPRRIAIVDDDPVVRAHFRDIVARCSTLVVAGEAGSVLEAMSLIETDPDLYLLDLGLPDGSGLDVVPTIRTRSKARVLVVTTFGDRETVVRALQAGADGYLLKDSEAGVILAGIEATLAGGAPISPAAAVYLLDVFRVSADDRVGVVPDQPSLTPRELELLKLFATGASYKEAARALEISPLTVGNYVKSIYRKLAVNSRGEAVYEAIAGGHIKI